VARFSGERPPFFFMEDGVWVGFDVDLGQDIAARMGVRYEETVQAVSFDEVVVEIAQGAADIGVSKLSATLDRALQVRFSSPYLTVYQAVVVNRVAVRRAADPFGELNDRRYTVGALAGSAYVGYARASLSNAQVRPHDDFAEMMADVVSGDLHAVLMDSARANTWRRANAEHLIQVRTVVDNTRRDPLAVAISWENPNLLAWVDLYLATIRADGTADRLYQKWFGDPATTQRR